MVSAQDAVIRSSYRSDIPDFHRVNNAMNMKSFSTRHNKIEVLHLRDKIMKFLIEGPIQLTACAIR